MSGKPAILQSFFNRFIYNPEARGLSFSQNGLQAFYDYIGYTKTDADEDVSVEKATRIETVFSCINALSQDVARLPLRVRQKTDKGRVDITNNISYLLKRRPNPYTSPFNFWYTVVFHAFAWGNGYALIVRNKRQPYELVNVHPSHVQCVKVDGEIYYRVEGIEPLIKQTEMLHFKMYSFDGIVGVSPLLWCANTMGYRIKQNKYKARVIGERPPGFISFAENLNAEQIKQAQEMWRSQTQGKNLGKTGVLSHGAKYNQLSMDPESTQMIESLDLNDEQITGIYRVPPTVIQKYKDSAFKGPDQQDSVYLKYTLSPILTMIEQECDYKLFSEANKMSESPLYTKYNVKEMLRGSLKEQGEWYKLMITLGLMSFNEVREMEDAPPFEGGDMRVIQGAYVPLDQLEDFYKGKSAQDGNSMRQLGFEIQEQIKEALSRKEILNKHE